MKKKFVKVALFSLLACGAAASLTSCDNDDWKAPVENVETATADIKATLTQVDQQIKQLDTKIADNKAAAAAAATAAENAMKAAGDASDAAKDAATEAEKAMNEAIAASKSAEAASKLAEQAAAQAQQAAAEQLKKTYEELKALIETNAQAIAANKALIDGNTDAIQQNVSQIAANAGKIEGNTQAIADILAELATFAKSDDVNDKLGDLDAKYQAIVDQLAKAGVKVEELQGGIEENAGKLQALSGTVAGLEAALKVLEGKSEALGLRVDELEKAIRADMGTLEQTLAAQIVAEAELRQKGDEELLGKINEVKGQISDLADKFNALDLATNIQDFAAFQRQTETQLAALEAFKTKMQGDFANLTSKVDGLEAKITENVGKIDKLITDLNTTNALAQANQQAIAAQLVTINNQGALIAANQTSIAELKTQVADLKTANDTLADDIAAANQRIDDIVEQLNALEPLLNTMILDQLRGLVFIPDAFVGGIESALSYHMLYKPLTLIEGTKATKTYSIDNVNYVVKAAKTWNNAVAAEWLGTPDKNLEYNPHTVVSYHMNPASAVVTYDALKVVSNDAEILSRDSKAGITLDPSYNDNQGMKIADGVLSVAIKGDATVFGPKSKKMPIFALQAEVQGKVDENNQPIVNTITSDYAMFAQMNVRPLRLQYNETNYLKNFKNARELTPVKSSQDLDVVLRNGTSTTVAWNGSVDLLPLIEIAYNDIKRSQEGVWTSAEDWSKFGLKLSFSLVDYTIGSNTVSESSWAVIDPETGVLTACVGGNAGKQSPDALGHTPLVYMTVKHGNTLVLDGFIKVKIVPTVNHYITDTVFFPVAEFTCEGYGDKQNDELNIFKMIEAATDFSRDVIRANYKPLVYDAQDQDGIDCIMQQFYKDGDIFVGKSKAEDLGTVAFNELYAPEADIYETNFSWILETPDLQAAYESANHTGVTYVCYASKSENYPDIFIPLSISVKDKAVGTVGDKLEARWFRDMTTALLNVKAPYDNSQVSTISTDLNQLWRDGQPKFAWASGYPKSSFLNTAGYKYYFPAANNRTYEGVTYTVENATNPNLISNVRASNRKMGDLALMTNASASEYNNTVLKANGQVLATLNPTTGQITLATNATALKLLNKFPSMGGEDRPEAKLEAIVGIVPYSSCDIAFKLTNPDFVATFLRPINVDSKKGYEFTDAEANGDPIKIFGMLTFSDWRSAQFASNEWLFGYYNVKSIVPDLSRMTTNAGTISSDPNHFAVDPTVTAAFGYTRPADVTYNMSDIRPAGSSTIKRQLTNEFGSITYNNTKLNIQSFKVRIPFTVTYGLGQFEVWVECSIKSTLQ